MAALRVSFSRGGHDWGVLSGACMNLVVLYFTTAANLGGGWNNPGEEENGPTATVGGDEDAVARGGLEVDGRLEDRRLMLTMPCFILAS